MSNVDQESERQQRLTSWQSRYDEALAPFSRHAPRPSAGQRINNYRRQALTYLLSFTEPNNRWRDVKMDSVPADALNVADRAIVDSARVVSERPRLMAMTPSARVDSLDPSLRQVEVDRGGTKITMFYPPPEDPTAIFTRAMGRPGRRVAGFYTNNGYITTSGTMMR
jgi:hypothetical protein